MSTNPADWRRSRFNAMGTEVSLVLAATAPGGAEEAVRALFEARERALSRFRADSDLSRLNCAAGRAVTVSALLMEAVEAALAGARVTGGAFDPCLGAHLVAAGDDRSFATMPPVRPRAAAAAGGGGGWRAVEVNREGGTVRLPAGATLDLGGIAKGMAVDAALALLSRTGVPAALVSAGGDLAAYSRPGAERRWQIAVPMPGGDAERVEIAGGALATSGVGNRRWRQDGEERHHPIDPRTGTSAAGGLWSASVAARTCREAEVAATAAVVLDETAAPALLGAMGLPALLVTAAGEPRPVGAWPRRQAA